MGKERFLSTLKMDLRFTLNTSQSESSSSHGGAAAAAVAAAGAAAAEEEETPDPRSDSCKMITRKM